MCDWADDQPNGWGRHEWRDEAERAIEEAQLIASGQHRESAAGERDAAETQVGFSPYLEAAEEAKAAQEKEARSAAAQKERSVRARRRKQGASSPSRSPQRKAAETPQTSPVAGSKSARAR